MTLDYNSPAALKAFLDSSNMAMQKKFGQNFMVSETARKKIADSLEINENSTVWEVGPGLGAMTNEILLRGATVIVFEIDKGFIKTLENLFQEQIAQKKLKIISGDVLKTWKKTLSEQGMPDVFFGNLPYNIAATLIADTIEENVRFEKCVFTVQKEVCQRAMAKFGSKDYSSFSVLCQWAYKIKKIADFAPNNFWPRPNVDSSTFSMSKNNLFPGCKNPKLFVKLQRSLFSSRRKTVKNNLTAFLLNSQKASEVLQKSNIDENLRAEALSIEQMLLLCDNVEL